MMLFSEFADYQAEQTPSPPGRGEQGKGQERNGNVLHHCGLLASQQLVLVQTLRSCHSSHKRLHRDHTKRPTKPYSNTDWVGET